MAKKRKSSFDLHLLEDDKVLECVAASAAAVTRNENSANEKHPTTAGSALDHLAALSGGYNYDDASEISSTAMAIAALAEDKSSNDIPSGSGNVPNNNCEGSNNSKGSSPGDDNLSRLVLDALAISESRERLDSWGEMSDLTGTHDLTGTRDLTEEEAAAAVTLAASALHHTGITDDIEAAAALIDRPPTPTIAPALKPTIPLVASISSGSGNLPELPDLMLPAVVASPLPSPLPSLAPPLSPPEPLGKESYQENAIEKSSEKGFSGNLQAMVAAAVAAMNDQLVEFSAAAANAVEAAGKSSFSPKNCKSEGIQSEKSATGTGSISDAAIRAALEVQVQIENQQKQEQCTEGSVRQSIGKRPPLPLKRKSNFPIDSATYSIAAAMVSGKKPARASITKTIVTPEFGDVSSLVKKDPQCKLSSPSFKPDDIVSSETTAPTGQLGTQIINGSLFSMKDPSTSQRSENDAQKLATTSPYSIQHASKPESDPSVTPLHSNKQLLRLTDEELNFMNSTERWAQSTSNAKASHVTLPITPQRKRKLQNSTYATFTPGPSLTPTKSKLPRKSGKNDSSLPPTPVAKNTKRKSAISPTTPMTPPSSTPMSKGQSSQKWDDMFECLVKFIEEKREEALKGKTAAQRAKEKWIWDGNVPTTYKTKDGKALGRWINNQRSAKHKGGLKIEREARLVSTGLKWSVLSTNSWPDMMDELRIYVREKTKDGQKWDGNVPTNYRIKSNTAADGSEIDEEKNLGRWINRQRSLYQCGKLKKERQKELEEIGLKWSVLSTTTWQSMYESLCEYVQMKRDSDQNSRWDGNVPANYKTASSPPKNLGRWVNRQRSAHSKGKLKPEFVEKLEELGLKWTMHEKKSDRTDAVDDEAGDENISDDEEDLELASGVYIAIDEANATEIRSEECCSSNLSSQFAKVTNKSNASRNTRSSSKSTQQCAGISPSKRGKTATKPRPRKNSADNASSSSLTSESSPKTSACGPSNKKESSKQSKKESALAEEPKATLKSKNGKNSRAKKNNTPNKYAKTKP